MNRQLVLLAYDIGQPRLQAQVRKQIRNEASGYQLSAYACYLNQEERRQLLTQLQPLITEDDSLIACTLDSTRPIYYLGQAKPPADKACCIIE
jgi:CRISPR-associated endoribonuclease Cas2